MGLVSLVGQQGERDCYFNFYYIGLLNSVQSLSRVWLFVTPWTTQWTTPWTIPCSRLLCPSLTPGACSNSRASVSDAIQPSHPLVSPFPPAFNLSQHQGLFHWVSSSHQVAKVIAQSVKNLPTIQEARVQFLGWEDPLDKEMATHSSILAWRIPRTKEPSRPQSMDS